MALSCMVASALPGCLLTLSPTSEAPQGSCCEQIPSGKLGEAREEKKEVEATIFLSKKMQGLLGTFACFVT